MRIKIDFISYLLNFKFPAGTSRGTMYEKLTYFISIRDIDNPECVGFGEVPFFKGLSKESQEEVESQLRLLTTFDELNQIDITPLSSVSFGLEMAINDLKNKCRGLYFPSDFIMGKKALVINGLIWMGDFSLMQKRVDEKLDDGYRCIKIKIGAIKWENELDLIRYVREKGGKDLIIRLDANGAFKPEECLFKLDALSNFDIHSIEQPIKNGNLTAMKRICEQSPIPIALDEDLIGLPIGDERSELLNFVKPQYIVLKPALCYGFSGAYDWVTRAALTNTEWWITSALESNVGLDAISQFTASLDVSVPQGLGTGNLYHNNFASPLSLDKDLLSFTGPSDIYRHQLDSLFRL